MSEATLSPAEIKAELANCYGTFHYYRHFMSRKHVYTDGIQTLINLCGCAWLIDIVISVRSSEEFQNWKIVTDLENSTAVVTMDDGNGNVKYTQEIPYTDFPLEEMNFYCEYGSIDGVNPIYVIMLTSER